MVNTDLHPTFDAIIEKICSNHKTTKKVVHQVSSYFGNVKLIEFDGHNVTIGVHYSRNVCHILFLNYSILQIENDLKLRNLNIRPHALFEIKWGVSEKYISMTSGIENKIYFYDSRNQNNNLDTFLFDRYIEIQKLLFSAI